jgi:tripartite-type tricarboxylate transporter receptor subunit TctC
MHLILAALALGALILSAAPVTAQTPPVESFYRGKQLKLLVGSEAGNDYDNWGRFVAHALVAHIPGKPTIVVENMPGGGTIVVANYLYNIAPKDGTVLATFSRNLPSAAVLGRPNIKFDPRRFNWLGSPERLNRVCAANTDARVQTAADLFTTELLVGGAGAGAVPSFLPVLLNNLLGTKFKLIEGYSGSGSVFLAMDRREVEGICITLGVFTGPRANLLQDGKVRLLFNTESKRLASFPEVPTIQEFIKTDEQRQIITFVNASLELGRPFTLPPGVPPERVRLLRESFAAAVADPAFLAEAARLHYEVTYTSGAEQQELIEKLYATPPDMLAKAAALMPSEN